ncbi:hypothetical protein D0817_00820 [Flavobacterium cupreum]|uniref:Alpha/beta hydrolase n=1 Tax=Flavobacterium cupreum TaxID=2133766 RepID=A0A434ACX0_9FLAO|nr:hypothetical protein [Flavobacterium cupreum]RUT72193.1 hypothetical protein D0817_00820 [Flavobacterium cupreum]
MRTNILKLMMISISLFLVSCNKDDDDKDREKNYTLSEVQAIARITGNQSSNIVVVNMQGGPLYELNDTAQMIDFADAKNALWVDVQQIQTLNPDWFNKDISFAEAKTKAGTNAENVDKVVSYYKSKGKTVCLVGVSYGAFVAQDYIARYGTSKISKALIVAGRLEMENEFWEKFSEGYDGEYVYGADGKVTCTFIENKTAKDRNLGRLAAALGCKRFTALWENVKGLDKIMYYYGTKDEKVGNFTAEEIKFLVSKKVQLFSVPEGNHDDTSGAGVSKLKEYFQIP